MRRRRKKEGKEGRRERTKEKKMEKIFQTEWELKGKNVERKGESPDSQSHSVQILMLTPHLKPRSVPKHVAAGDEPHGVIFLNMVVGGRQHLKDTCAIIA